MYSDGTSTRVTTVANITPKLSDIAMGIRNCACTLFSKNTSGVRPAKVVKLVSQIALNRATPLTRTASIRFLCFGRLRLTKSTEARLIAERATRKGWVDKMYFSLCADGF